MNNTLTGASRRTQIVNEESTDEDEFVAVEDTIVLDDTEEDERDSTVLDEIIPFPWISSSDLTGAMCCGCGECMACYDTTTHPQHHSCFTNFTSNGLPRVKTLTKANDDKDVNYKPLKMPTKHAISQPTKLQQVAAYLENVRPGTPFTIPTESKSVLMCGDCSKSFEFFLKYTCKWVLYI